MRLRRPPVLVRLVFASSAAALAAACVPDPLGTPIDAAPYDAGVSGAGVGTQAAGSCAASSPVPVDPATLPACCAAGGAHCAPLANVDPTFATQLSACAGGVCTPDPFLRDPGYAPAPCASLSGAAGVCLSECIPQIAQYGTLLPTDVCAAGERCAPCISPLDSKPTGACDLGKPAPPRACDGGGAPSPAGGGGTDASAAATCPHVGPPVIDPATLAACGTAAGAHCLASSLVPPAEVALLAPCFGGSCVPDTFLTSGGQFIPPSCRAAGDIEGRCLHQSLPSVAGQLASLVVSTCAAYERCVPCFDPLSGADTTACHLGCDPGPREPASPYATCCVRAASPAPLGTCIPVALVPAAQRSNLATDTCAASQSLCVPDEQLHPVTPPTCTATGLVGGAYTGVCLSACLSFDFLSSLGIAQGSCDGVHVCAPCTNPITHQPTGAPGCPP